MVLRVLQILLAIGNCGYGVLLLQKYGNVAMQIHSWPLTMSQDVILLIAVAVLPSGVVALRFPVVAGIFEFACAFIGLQLLHDKSLVQLKYYSHVTMFLAAGILILAVFRGVSEVTHEAFHKPEEKQRRKKAHHQHPQHHRPKGHQSHSEATTHTIHPRHGHTHHPAHHKPRSKSS